ncbi:MAG: hypothetical protein HKN82_09970 [Akkermansiaceae bacterium]|nr:hypothetical protein [Akkermansiaceae bacterium]NNM30939.1 hypothetical protein [Akkermansiaceae bacterium]
MSRFPLLLLVLWPALLVPTAAPAAIDEEIPLGAETVAGVRTGYVYRGFDLADALTDFQLETELAVAQDVFLNIGGWVASELGDDFTEAAFFVDLRRTMNEFYTLGASASYHDFDDALFFRDTTDVGAFITMFHANDLDVTFGAYRDIVAEAWYANAEAGWSYRLSDDAYFGLLTGLSWVDDYYGRDGINDFYGRATVTYNINRLISLTPFFGWSLEIEDADGDEYFGGLWFEVLF